MTTEHTKSLSAPWSKSDMTNKERIQFLKSKTTAEVDSSEYYSDLLEEIGGLKRNYYDYLITEPIQVDEELKRVETADFDLCCAMLTMLIREDHFGGYGCFERRCENGDVQRIIDRMLCVLEDRETETGRRLRGRDEEYLMLCL